jgi:hypothetical protein
VFWDIINNLLCNDVCCIKPLATLITQKYSILEKFFTRSYLIDNKELKISTTKKIEAE